MTLSNGEGRKMTAGFPPIAGKEARLLILGTMPSVKSQEKRQYYGHPQNAVWPILYALWERPLEADYGRRCRFLLDQDIALWDVLARCCRTGSADTAIREPAANDFTAFAAAHPHIQGVFFNSQNAGKLYERLVKPDPFSALPKITLPSTSPARAMRFEDKLALWRPLRRFWEEAAGKC